MSTKQPDKKVAENRYEISCPIVTKNFVKKNGQATDHREYYLRRSIQDYFIKFCEGGVTRDALEHALEAQRGVIKSLTLEVEFKKGNWDICDGNLEQQSRVGDYVVLYKIIESNK